MKKFINIALSVLTGLSLFMVVGVTPASASWSQCPANQHYLCTWDGNNATGAWHTFHYSLYGNGACWNLTGGVGGTGNNAWSSVYERFGYAYADVYMFDKFNCWNDPTNTGTIIDSNTQLHLDTYNDGYYNNKFSSFLVENL